MGIERIGVVGAGVMGSEIAQVAAAAGLSAVMVDVADEALTRGVEHIRDIGTRRVARGRLEEAEAEAILGRITTATDLAAIGDCDLIVEAGPEVMDLKRALWRAIDDAARPDALLASNTSGLSITALGRETRRPNSVLGLHFFNPASVMRLVEVIRGQDTDEASVDAALAISTRLGKRPVVVRECPGFLVNRILVRAVVESYRVADELAAARSSADLAVAEGGPAPMGSFALGDLVGLDTMLHVQRDLEHAYGERFAAGPSLAAEVAAGRLGQKSGAGFIAGGDADAPDDQGPNIAERYYLGALDEACRCLDEGIAALEDIDLAMQLGAGWTDGPLAWADQQGLAEIAGRLASLTVSAGERFAPRPALNTRLSTGQPFISTPKED